MNPPSAQRMNSAAKATAPVVARASAVRSIACSVRVELVLCGKRGHEPAHHATEGGAVEHEHFQRLERFDRRVQLLEIPQRLWEFSYT